MSEKKFMIKSTILFSPEKQNYNKANYIFNLTSKSNIINKKINIKFKGTNLLHKITKRYNQNTIFQEIGKYCYSNNSINNTTTNINNDSGTINECKFKSINEKDNNNILSKNIRINITALNNNNIKKSKENLDTYITSNISYIEQAKEKISIENSICQNSNSSFLHSNLNNHINKFNSLEITGKFNKTNKNYLPKNTKFDNFLFRTKLTLNNSRNKNIVNVSCSKLELNINKKKQFEFKNNYVISHLNKLGLENLIEFRTPREKDSINFDIKKMLTPRKKIIIKNDIIKDKQKEKLSKRLTWNKIFQTTLKNGKLPMLRETSSTKNIFNKNSIYYSYINSDFSKNKTSTKN